MWDIPYLNETLLGLLTAMRAHKLIYSDHFGQFGERMTLPISAEIARWQRINLNYWYSNCKCDCKSCYEMRKSIKTLMKLEENEYYETKHNM